MFEVCKIGQVFPEIESKWSFSELVKVLKLSGITGNLPKEYTYNDIVNLLIDHLNMQSPAVYALSTADHIILNSQTVQIVRDSLNIGPYAVLQKLQRNECQHIWQVFFQHFHTEPKRFAIAQITPEEMEKKQLKIVELQSKIEKLEKKFASSHVGQLTKQMEEANRVLKSYKTRLNNETQKETDNQLKVIELNRKNQQLEAQIYEYKIQLEKIRGSLGQNWETTLDKLGDVKQCLANCQREKPPMV
jgi:hypothetical protein